MPQKTRRAERQQQGIQPSWPEAARHERREARDRACPQQRIAPEVMVQAQIKPWDPLVVESLTPAPDSSPLISATSPSDTLTTRAISSKTSLVATRRPCYQRGPQIPVGSHTATLLTQVYKRYMIRLGYPTQNLTIPASTNRTLRLANLGDAAKVCSLVLENLLGLEAILRWNAEHGVPLFRMGQSLVPFASHPAFPYDWEDEHGDDLRDLTP